VPTVIHLSSSDLSKPSKIKFKLRINPKSTPALNLSQHQPSRSSQVKSSRPKRSGQAFFCGFRASIFACSFFVASGPPLFFCATSTSSSILLPCFKFGIRILCSGSVISRYYEGFSNLPQLGAAATPANYQCVINPLFTWNDETKQNPRPNLNIIFWLSLGGIEKKHKRKGKYFCLIVYFLL
jgi:hypothetical protein